MISDLQLSTRIRDLRKFGLVVGGVFLLLGGGFLFPNRPAGPYFLTPGVLLLVFGWSLRVRSRLFTLSG